MKRYHKIETTEKDIAVICFDGAIGYETVNCGNGFRLIYPNNVERKLFDVRDCFPLRDNIKRELEDYFKSE